MVTKPKSGKADKAGKKEAVAHIQALGLGASAHMRLRAHKREYMPGEENELAVACAGLVSAHTRANSRE